MYLIPRPKYYKEDNGIFSLNEKTKLILSPNSTFKDLDSAIFLKKEMEKRLGILISIEKGFKKFNNSIYIIVDNSFKDETYKLIINSNEIKLIGKSGSGIFYGVQTLIQIIRRDGLEIQNLFIEDEPYFKSRGYLYDITRGKVPKLSFLKEIIDKAAFYKLNQVQLYIEHSFAFEGMSEVWVDKDPLTSEEILLLDEYARKRHVELVPALATFGHLYEVLRTKSYEDLCELENKSNEEFSFIDRMAHHTLDVSNNKSIELVKKMIEEFIPLFSSNKFNICCDETFDLGKGKSKILLENKKEGVLYVEFLNKVIDIVKNYNKQVLFWGDIIINHKELLNDIPKDVICLNWNYCSNVSEEGTKIIYKSKREMYVCPGVGGWNRLINLIPSSLENINRMIRYGKKYNAVGVLNTDWGDFGHINSFTSSIIGLAYGANLSWNPNVEKDFEKFYKEISLIEFGDEEKKIVDYLVEVSKCQTVSYEDIIKFKERNLIPNVNINDIEKDLEKAIFIKDKIRKLSINIKEKNFIREFILLINGIILINEFFIFIFEKNKNNYLLAEKFEWWFYDYSIFWREKNKESELYRIREVIQFISKYLREN